MDVRVDEAVAGPEEAEEGPVVEGRDVNANMSSVACRGVMRVMRPRMMSPVEGREGQAVCGGRTEVVVLLRWGWPAREEVRVVLKRWVPRLGGAGGRGSPGRRIWGLGVDMVF